MYTIIFTGGKCPAPKSIKSRIEKIFSEIDLVIAADSGLESLESFNRETGLSLVPDFILGDMDSLSNKDVLSRYSEKQIFIHPRDKDFSDTELALINAREESEGNTVVLVGASGGRVDHFLSVMDLFTKPHRMDLWITEEQLLAYMEGKSTYEIKVMDKLDNISFANPPNVFQQDSISTRNLVWEGDLFSKNGMPSLSNRITEEAFLKGENIEIVTGSAPLIAILPLDAEISNRK